MYYGLLFIFSSPYNRRIIRSPSHWHDIMLQCSEGFNSTWNSIEYYDDYGFKVCISVSPENFDRIYSLFVDFGLSERLPWLLRYWSERFPCEGVSCYAL